MSPPLAGVKVIDITTVVMGPYATQILGDLGADVVKIESPEGDNTRHAGPMRHRSMGDRFLHLNRGKRSVVLNLKHPDGRSALLKLIESADVLIYNVRPQAMARLGLSYADVSAVNKKIIYVGAYGFSQRGPYASRPAYDDLIQGMAAIPWLIAKAGLSEPGYIPATLVDRIVGLHVVYAVTAALFQRTKQEVGQAIEVPMFEAISEMVLGDHLGGHTFVPPLGEPGYDRVLATERRPYKTRDGYICVLIYNDKQWRSFFKLIGREKEFNVSSYFATHECRARHPAKVNEFVAQQMASRSSREWLDLLSSADIPAATLNSLEDLIDDPHLAAIGFFTKAEHPSEGPILTMAPTIRWLSHSSCQSRPAPRLGEHSVEVLREIGYSQAELAKLIAAGATVDGNSLAGD